MRLPKEIVVLLVLLAVMVIGVLWYVIDRRAKNRLPADAKQSAGQMPAGQPAGTAPRQYAIAPARP